MRVVVTHWVHPDVTARLAEFCRPVGPSREQGVWSRAEVLARAGEADGLVACMADRVDDELLAACPRLRVVSGVFKGHDTIDVAACVRRGVQATVLAELLTAPTAELVVGLTLALRRRLVEGDAWVRSGRHTGWRPRFYGGGLAGACVGIIGMGRIGRAVASRLSGFEAAVVYSDPVPLPEAEERRLGARRVTLPELLAGSDVVVPLVPLTERTRHLVDAEALGRMRPGACVVNASRGSVVDEHAVAEALHGGRLGGYAADVFAFEDTAASNGIPAGLLEHPRTVFTPHLGSAVGEVRREMGLAAAEQVRDALAGRHPDGAITPRCPR
ncbi:NAD(P)-dependent oxidoreductase [Pseudonocardia acaciae]|uniref:NAD(P)-dependent oxidoreductase n=1 Tax=Pseudonocardia acaciae TaxID=551276 RepID=UPI0005617E49|nr:NAD(P)-dependent oxidoreductase [Pseudonocardia acaciae]